MLLGLIWNGSVKSAHDILGISPSATEAEIKQAYRRLAGRLHPDRTGGDRSAEEQLKEVNRAYRDAMEQLRSPNSSLNGDFEEMFRSTFADDFFSVFSGLSGMGRRSPNPQIIDVPLSFEEALSGVVKQATMRRWKSCDSCGGRRSASCQSCQGAGRVSVSDRVEFRIPRGSDTDEVIHARSDLGFPMVARLVVEPSTVWERSGLDLRLLVPVPAPHLQPGAKIEAASPYGSVELSVPSGFNTERWLRVPGHGIRHASGATGALLVRLVAEVAVEGQTFTRSNAYNDWLKSRQVLSAD